VKALARRIETRREAAQGSREGEPLAAPARRRAWGRPQGVRRPAQHARSANREQLVDVPSERRRPDGPWLALFAITDHQTEGRISMHHVSYGLFDDDDHARAAIDAIEASGTHRQHIGVTLHRGRVDEGLLGAEGTGASAGAREGAVIAGIMGAITGAVVMGPIGLVSGGVMGALYGTVGGALAGSGFPDRNLEQLSKHLAEGKVLVVVEAPSLESRDKADAAMQARGARVEHKPFF